MSITATLLVAAMLQAAPPEPAPKGPAEATEAKSAPTKKAATPKSPPPKWLVDYNRERIDRSVEGMTALTVWAGANMLAGAIGWPLAEEEQWQAFHSMNLAWGAVNLAIALPSLVRNLNADPATMSFADTLKAEEDMKAILLLNAGLDVAYLTAGALLWERGDFGNDDVLTGIGQSLIIQGAFLLVFDIVMAVVTSDAKADLYTRFREGGGAEVGFMGRF